MKTMIHSFKLSCALFTILIGAINISAQPRCLPPANSSYVANQHQTYGAAVFTNPIHYQFTQCTSPPTIIGNSTFHTFNSRVNGQFQSGGPVIMIDAPAQCSVRVTKTGQSGNQEFFQTEMLQLDITGGNMPPNMRIRESQTFQSTGQTTLTNNGGNFTASSFFDIFTELSTDNGATWIPANQPGHVVLTYSSAIPTISEWGLIILSLLILTFGIVAIRKRQFAIDGIEGVDVNKFLPIDRSIFIRSLIITLIVTLGTLAVLGYFYGTPTITDIAGAVVSSVIIAYIVHLFIASGKED